MPTASEKFTGDLRSLIRDVPDFPKQGILFRDVTPLLQHGPAFRRCMECLCEAIAKTRPTVIAGIESRGFIFGAAAATMLGVGYVPIRKPGKLPWKTRQQRYQLEYGSDGIEIHEDAVAAGTRVAWSMICSPPAAPRLPPAACCRTWGQRSSWRPLSSSWPA